MDALCEVYASAYGAAPGEDTQEKSSAFRERATAGRGNSTVESEGNEPGWSFEWFRRDRGTGEQAASDIGRSINPGTAVPSTVLVSDMATGPSWSKAGEMGRVHI